MAAYIADALNEEPVAVGPGIFYVFKDKIEEQKFLVQRQTRKKSWIRLSYSDHPEKLKIKQRSLLERHQELFGDFWDLCLELGRGVRLTLRLQFGKMLLNKISPEFFPAIAQYDRTEGQYSLTTIDAPTHA